MKKILLLALLISSFCSQAEDISSITTSGKAVTLHDDGTWTYNAKKVDVSVFEFRGSTWGISKERVKANEKNKIKYLIDDSDMLVFKSKIAGFDAYVYYIFVDDRLVRTKYAFQETHTNKNDFISDYKSLDKSLFEKYGDPADEKEIWKSNLYKDDPSRWGMAVSSGKLVYVTSWISGDTEINNYLHGDNYKIQHSVEYKSISLEGLEKSAKKKASSAEL